MSSKRIRRHWPKVDTWCVATAITAATRGWSGVEETQGATTFLASPANDVLDALTREAADAIAVQTRALGQRQAARLQRPFATAQKAGTRSGASWRASRHPKGLDVGYVVTSLKAGARHLYETLYCARETPRTSSSAQSQLASTAPPAAIPKPTSSA